MLRSNLLDVGEAAAEEPWDGEKSRTPRLATSIGAGSVWQLRRSQALRSRPWAPTTVDCRSR